MMKIGGKAGLEDERDFVEDLKDLVECLICFDD